MRAIIASAIPTSDRPWMLVAMVALFIGILAWSLRPAKTAELDETSRQPLND